MIKITESIMKKIAEYENGNYKVILFSDGTKIRYNDGDPFKAAFPENIDLKVTNWCDIGCPFCHEKSSIDGKIANFRKYERFFNSLKPGTELAMGGGKISSLLSPSLGNASLMLSLSTLKHRSIIVNMTFNQQELIDQYVYENIITYVNLSIINGIGVSYFNSKKGKEKLLDLRNRVGSRLVVHTIAGISTPDDYNWLAENGFKILILGYKNFGRGITYKSPEVDKKIKWVRDNIDFLAENCETVSFDCLATSQLKLKEYLSKEDWEKYYMGDDGTATMYVDLVEGKYGVNSTTPYDKRLDIPESQDVVEMFKNVCNK